MFDPTFHQVGQQIRDVLQAQANSLVHLGKDYPAYRLEPIVLSFLFLPFFSTFLGRETLFETHVYIPDNARFHYSTTSSA